MLDSFQCPGCGHMASQVPQMQSLQACPACGLTSDEGSRKMQEDLVGLFTRNMNVSGQQQVQAEPPQASSTPSALGYNSSQHYYPPPANLASKTIVAEDEDISQMLLQYNIDSSYLLSSQVSLFRNAAPEQRKRLVELWRITPLEQTRLDGLGGWKETSIEQEEQLAQARYERNLTGANATQSGGNIVVISEDADMDATTNDTDNQSATEPYMKSGYEILAERDYNKGSSMETSYRHALDPAFSAKEWWRIPMENQYGMYEHMSQFHPSEVRLEPEDAEML